MDEEESNGTARVIEASAKVVEAAAKLVEQVGGVLELARSPASGGVAPLGAISAGPDSEGWLERSLIDQGSSPKDARKAVVDRSTAFYERHKGEAAKPECPSQQELGRVYMHFFGAGQLTVNHLALKEFQKVVGYFDPAREGVTFGELPEKEGFPAVPHDDSNLSDPLTFKRPLDEWTIPQCLGRLMASYNRDMTGTPVPDRGKGLIPPWRMEPTHAQCVIFHHVLRTQEDVQLVAPYAGQVW